MFNKLGNRVVAGIILTGLGVALIVSGYIPMPE